MFEMDVAAGLGAVAGLVLTILLYIKVMPKKMDGNFANKKLQLLHDFFHFKKLYLEEVLRFSYVLATVSTVCIGALTMLSYTETYSFSYYSGATTHKESNFLAGLLIVVLGPIALRLAYEGLMMFILLVKNTIEINNKLGAPKKAEEPVAPVAPVVPVGTVYPPAPVAPVANVCPACGAPVEEGTVFCATCGNKIQ